MLSSLSTTLSRRQAASKSAFSGNNVPLKRLKQLDALLLPAFAPRLILFARFNGSTSSPRSSATKIKLLDPDQFNAASGFWPETEGELTDEHASAEPSALPRNSPPDQNHRRPVKGSKGDMQRSDSLDRLSVLLPRARGKKVDLSNISLKKWEASHQLTFFQPSQPVVRANAGLRRMLVSYIEEFDYCIPVENCNEEISNQPRDSDEKFRTVFSQSNLEMLDRSNYKVTDVMSWSWILNSGSARLAIQRYIAFAESEGNDGLRRIPLFVPLQILRAESVDAASLKTLLKLLLRSPYAQTASIVDGGPVSSSWDQNSAALLIVRLIRHSRKVAPSILEDIVSLASHVLPQEPNPSPADQQRLSHIYNRLLSLLALPTSLRPFRSISKQQQAQIKLVQRMLDLKPQVPLTREGYRALVKVQLAHEKTNGERDWAAAKGLSWPPWREDKLGIQADLEYPGNQSRAMKILNRMREAGYDHFNWEKTAAILAGWDTDKSPTIQTRSILGRPIMSWLGGFMSTKESPVPDCDPMLWAVRITATRTLREAWACFISYRKEVRKIDQSPQHYHVYYAMFQKLFARSHNRGSLTLPGDTKEIFADPVAQRDLVYVETEPPSVSEFYSLMVSSAVRPAGRLLSELLDHVEIVHDGFQYIRDSSFGEVKKDVLLHAEKYPSKFIRDTLSNMPDHFLAAFVKFLSRSRADTSLQLSLPSSLAAGSGNLPKSTKSITPLAYGSRMLYISETQYLPAWNGHLEGLIVQLRDHKIFRAEVWRRMIQTLKYMRMADVHPDFTTFQQVSKFIETYAMLPSQIWPPLNECVSMMKALFSHIAYGNEKHAWIQTAGNTDIEAVPDPEDIRSLVKLLGVAQDLIGIRELVSWMNRHSEQLHSAYSERRSGELAMRQTLTIIRVYTEALWKQEDMSHKFQETAAEEVEALKKQCEPFGWPSDDDLEVFMSEHQTWLRAVRFKIEGRVEGEARKQSRSES